MVKIKKMFQRSDDNYDVVVGEVRSSYEYMEIYPQEVVVNGFTENAYIIVPQAFCQIIPTHIPKTANFVPNNDLLISGLMIYYNIKTQEIFLYNCTQNHIYIKKDTVIGEIYHG